MQIISTIEFKALPEFYRKEAEGIKPNTVRIVSKAEDLFISKCIKDIKYIRIKNTNEDLIKKSFVRELIDITRFESHGVIIYIFSW